jgi:hypothetical protein
MIGLTGPRPFGLLGITLKSGTTAAATPGMFRAKRFSVTVRTKRMRRMAGKSGGQEKAAAGPNRRPRHIAIIRARRNDRHRSTSTNVARAS